ncbi:hypothetical protein DL89DRAFT_286290 [Linderina pennispora]|uniref:Ketosynthase family 3 (KS3) domain-containing protein n=1 Tax=Linderina pennispora TaxID=61395 RepID=A0A1Y1W0E6_9FUNG|nr:uncharacterized protein DL89DRAFT_286290 [Linderina pennispora]ORX66584.1 hypothetical protein DL89DRAFT_286290 [Linderina pennispora]
MAHYPITIVGTVINVSGSLSAQAEVLTARFPFKDSPTEIETVARFVNFAATENADVAVAVFQHLHQKYCSTDNIHVVVQQLKLTTEQAQSVLKGYYSMLPDVPRPALFANGKVKLTAMFGGQGGMDNYLDEATWLLDVYRPLLAGYVTEMAAFLLDTSKEDVFADVYEYPVDLLDWLYRPESRPDMEYLSLAPVAAPILALIQLMHLMVLYKTLGLSPGELSQSFKGAIGHSQGVVLAAMLPTLTDEKSFYDNSRIVLGILIAGGSRIQLDVPLDTIDVRDASNSDDGGSKPSPMVSIRGVPLPALEKLIAHFNSCCLLPIDHVFLALINSFDSFVVTGRLKVVMQFVQFLHQHCAEPGADQSNTPFSVHKPVVDMSYVNSSIVTHCPLLQDTADWIYAFVTERGWVYKSRTGTGADLDTTRMVIDKVCILRVDWPATVKGADATHIVDLSPGGFSVFARLARGIVDGGGVNIISCSSFIPHKHRLLGSKADLFQRNIRLVIQSMDWKRAFSPRLVRVKSTAQVHINSPMFHALGRPPVMVSTVEPSTTSVQLVAAAINAGYHAELSTTGITSAGQLQRRVADLVQLIEPGQGITLCCDYSSQEQWTTLFPEILRMRQAGQPIVGLSISGSIPSAAAATDIIAGIRDAGLRHVTLKAATLADIRATIAISKVDRMFPVILQCMGGRNGGYHSWDDFYQPILDTYSLLRFHRNIVLVAGSGIGDADTAMQYMSGSWSVPFGRPPMPFDGVVLGSCVMVAKESGLSDTTKQLIAGTAGVGPNEWMDTYSGVVGGVTSIAGENGKPMHVIATRAALFVKELQGSIFSQAADKQTELLQQKRDSIVQRLNSDYIKPWFGQKADGSVAELQDMTYLEVIHRMIELMYVDDRSCWLDDSYCKIVGDFISRTENRFCSHERECIFSSYYELMDDLQSPIQSLLQTYPELGTQTVSADDVAYFLILCSRSDQYPVPFVPVLDGNLETWMLQSAVSLSASSGYITSHDVQRQLVPYGPVSAGYSSTANAPVRDILDGVYHAMVRGLCKNSPTTIPATEYIGAEPKPTTIQSVISRGIMGTGRLYTLPSDNGSLPDTDPWLELLAGPRKSWLRALLTSPAIVQGTKFVANGVRRIMRPMSNQSVSISESDGIPQQLEVFDSQGELNIVFEYAAPSNITAKVILPVNGENRELVLKFLYCPTRPAMPITEVSDGRDGRIHEFYFGHDNPPHPTLGDMSVDSDIESPVIRCQPFGITYDHIRQYCRNVQNKQRCYISDTSHYGYAPMDMVFLIGWQGLMAVLENRQLSSGLLDMVHLENSMDYIDSGSLLRVGDSITSEAELVSAVNSDAGKVLTISLRFFRQRTLIAQMATVLLFRGHKILPPLAFSKESKSASLVVLNSVADVAVLETKDWFVYLENSPAKLTAGSTVEFVLDTRCRFRPDGYYASVSIAGPVFAVLDGDKRVHIANVDYQAAGVNGNAVAAYLAKSSVDQRSGSTFDNGGHKVLPMPGATAQFRAPSGCGEYARVSGDYNPIHLSSQIASYVGLSRPIVHGMWVSAATRAVVERYAAGGDPARFRSFKTEFVGMVFPGDALDVELSHVGMKDGFMLFEGRTVNQHHAAVMTFAAKVEQPKTAYLFTGQGAQFVDMGMDLYAKSPAARDIWDRAEKHMFDKYGISLLDILHRNPKKFLVHFGGAAGKRVLGNYLNLSSETQGASSQLFARISPKATRFTYHSASGLLDSSLFAQPIQLVLALAYMADMESCGLIQPATAFAGHSLGELCSLAAIGKIVSVEAAVELAFFRGLILHTSVDRDDNGQSQYAMMAVNPSKVGEWFTLDILTSLVERIQKQCRQLLEINNHNIQCQQYIVTGHKTALVTLTDVLNKLCNDETFRSGCSNESGLSGFVSSTCLACKDRGAELANGTATTVITGVDVPSHSKHLLSSVDVFRNILLKAISPTSVDATRLAGKYIPNITGVPFEVTKRYISLVHSICQSPVLASKIEALDDSISTDSVAMDNLACMLLVELLAYQLAFPVQWIATQQSLLNSGDIRRVVEIGPAPVLGKMMRQSMSGSTNRRSSIELLHVSDNRKAVYFLPPEVNDVSSVATADEVQSEPTTLAMEVDEDRDVSLDHEQLVETISKQESSSQIVSQQVISEKPVDQADIVRAIIGQKLKRLSISIPVSQPIKVITAGKSTILNMIASDLQKEFGRQIPSTAEDMTIAELVGRLGPHDGKLGRHTQNMIAKVFSSKMPRGFSLTSAYNYLNDRYGLGRQRQEGLLLLALTMEPTERLTSEQDARQWLANIAQLYAKKEEITFTTHTAGPTTSPALSQSNAPVVNSDVFNLSQEKLNMLATRQIQALREFTGTDTQCSDGLLDTLKQQVTAYAKELSDLQLELGGDLINGTKQKFDQKKARHYNSYWNWVRQDVMQLVADILVKDSFDPSDVCVRKRLQMISNRSCPDLLTLVNGYLAVLASNNSLATKQATRVLEDLRQVCIDSSNNAPVYREISPPLRPCTVVTSKGDVVYSEERREHMRTFKDYVNDAQQRTSMNPHLLYISERHDNGSWAYSAGHTRQYFDSLNEIVENGLTFEGKAALVTGCGPGSIGSSIVEGLLTGGARVVATTSSYGLTTIRYFERPVQTVCTSMVQDGLGWDLSYVFPFAAFAERGGDLTNIDSRSELSFRILLTNVYRMIGAIKIAKEAHKYTRSPTLIVLPNSPNKGTIGNSGLYGEAKMALQSLYNRWHSESWSEYISLTGADIGFVRNTRMTNDHSVIFEGVEHTGVRTFSREEMAFNPYWAAESRHGGASTTIAYIPYYEFSTRIFGLHLAHSQLVAVNREVHLSNISDNVVQHQSRSSLFREFDTTSPLATHRISFPPTRSFDQLKPLHYLQGMINLDKVAVITGFGEVGPFGNARMRWEMEAFGELSMEGCIELAWIMGLIKHFDGQHPLTMDHYIGWVDAKTDEPVRDMDVKKAHVGVRFIEPELHDGYDPHKKSFVRELQISHDLEPFEATEDEAAHFKHGNGDRVETWENSNRTWSVRFLKGATLLVPKALRFDRYTATQIPTGWDPARYGIPQDIIDSVDRTTCYALVSAMEALVSSGITDPYELYQYFHVSEVGHTIGSSTGGVRSLRDIVVNRWVEKDVHSGVLIESLVNSPDAWINMLLLSSAGPLKPTSAACATALVALDVAIETIQSGKAKVMLAGAVEDYTQDTAYEFAQLQATANTVEELAKGRAPEEMSRPFTDTRSGYMESYGSGIFVVMSASAAIEIGAPIYGVVALTETATDKQGHNIGAPGRGILSTAREIHSQPCSDMLDFNYRKRGLQQEHMHIDRAMRYKRQKLNGCGASPGNQVAQSTGDAHRRRMAATDVWNTEFWKGCSDISPVRGALATWGLTADDIGMLSFHGTSTRLNDINEASVINKLLAHSGRTPGYPAPVVSQKWLTGHPKAPAAAWMLNGALQAISSGIIPGNRNADNIDPELRQYGHLVFPSCPTTVSNLKAALLSSFGLGQAGGIILVLNPDYILATLSADDLEGYQGKVEKRKIKANRYFQEALIGARNLISVKTAPPFTSEQEDEVYLNPLARASYDATTHSYHF